MILLLLLTALQACSATAPIGAEAGAVSPGGCRWGGDTPAQQAYCQSVNFGAGAMVSVLRRINRDILDGAARRNQPLLCTVHVAEARRRLGPYAGALSWREIDSCDRNPESTSGGVPICHASLLVMETASGVSWVMDNGHAIASAIDGVDTLDHFRAGVYRYILYPENPVSRS